MTKVLLLAMTFVCFTGFGALSFAEEMGKMKGEMKSEMMKGETKAKHDEMKAKHDEMKMKTDEMKMKKDEMMKGDMKMKKTI
ncbi:MAG: hypothetical protein HC938_11320 [Nitrospira sp.]|nr:hypothetical protein [Nitrospira sp.]